MSAEKIKTEKCISPVLSRYTPIVAERGEGAYIYDQDGTRYLDFSAGIGVTNTGHCHPRVVEAVQEQAAKLLHGQVNIVFHPPLLDLVQELRSIAPRGLDCFFFSNSGAEAVEGAVKLAKHATGRTNTIVFQGSFHGRTAMTMALTTSKTVYRVGYQPLPAGVFVAPFPYAYRYGWDQGETVDFCLNELRLLLKTQTAPEETAAMIVEPVLGEGGYVVPPKGFLKGLRRICDEHGILLIADEIQSGFGRTGKWFAIEHFGVDPDIMTIAKGLASGLPLSGVAASQELMDEWMPGTHGGTYGGNALACAAAAETIRVIRDEGLLENANKKGRRLMDHLERLQEAFPIIGNLRGLGLMVGCEMTHPDGVPAGEAAAAVRKACLDKNLILLTCGPWDNTVRWIPPLVVTDEEIDTAVQTFEEALREVTG